MPPCDSSAHCLPALRPTAPWPAVPARGGASGTPHNGRSPTIGQLPSRATAAIATLPAHCQPGIVGRLGHHLLMRPALKPGLLPVWRNRDTIQIGIDPRRAIALTGMRRAAGLLRLLDGSRDRVQVLDAARDLGMDPEMTDRVLSLLAAGGALDDIPASTYDTLSAALRARLAPELATASLAHGDADGGARTLARRQAACVRVHGASRAGLWIAALLTSAGIGLVVSTGPTPARQAQDIPDPPEPPGLPGGATARPTL